MASKSVLNHENLAALGAERLAALLLEVATGDAATKRRLRLELAAAESPRKLAADLQKRLTALRTGKTFIGWRGLKGLVAELTALRGLIEGPLAQAEPASALELMWAFLDLADGLLERTSDTSGAVLDIFRGASAALSALAGAARPELKRLVADATQAILANGYGQADGLIGDLAPHLGDDGLKALRQALGGANAREKPAALRVRRTGRWRRGRRLERDLVARRTPADIVHRALLDIADALHDVDAYIALQTRRGDPASVVAVARRLVDAGRFVEALEAIDGVKDNKNPAAALFALKAEALDGLGRPDEAQACRLDGFHRTLEADLLRPYLKRLPDFDDIEAEDEALDFAWQSKDADRALDFLVRWPSLDRAATLVMERSTEIEANNDDLLLLAAAKLGPRYPLPALLLLRKLVNAILMQSRTRDYARAADYLSDAEQMAARVEDFRGLETHDAYVARLRANFRYRQDFWDLAA
jgi:hypothetical protein